MNCGTIIYDQHFQFTNGQILDKLLIVLCEFGVDHLVLTVTSQPKNRTPIPGCHIKSKPPTFFLPKGSCWFNKDTWVELHVVNELPSYRTKSVKQYEGALSVELMKQILDCLLESDFVEEYYLDHVRKVRETLA